MNDENEKKDDTDTPILIELGGLKPTVEVLAPCERDRQILRASGCGVQVWDMPSEHLRSLEITAGGIVKLRDTRGDLEWEGTVMDLFKHVRLAEAVTCAVVDEWRRADHQMPEDDDPDWDPWEWQRRAKEALRGIQR